MKDATNDLELNESYMDEKVERDLNLSDYKRPRIEEAIEKLEKSLDQEMKDLFEYWPNIQKKKSGFYNLNRCLVKCSALSTKLDQFYGIQADWEARAEKMKEMHADGTIARGKAKKKLEKQLKEKPHD